MPNPKKPRTPCRTCGKEPAGASYKYCSNICQLAFQRRQRIAQWKRGEISGLSKMGLVSRLIKEYLREKFGNKCCLCGWSEVNPKTGLVPVVADHIDGNWRNNREENLRLLCPNCDSLNPTFAGANKGRSGRYRYPSNRAREARAVA